MAPNADRDAGGRAPRVGSVLNGDLILDAQLGGRVFHATRAQRELAVRIVHPPNATLATKLAERVRAAGRALHPALAKVEAYGQAGDDGSYFIASEWVQGQSLSALANLPIEQSVVLVHDLCSGLDVAHTAGIAHDALHPLNVRVLDGDSASARPHLKLLDLEVPARSHEHWHDPFRLSFLSREQLEALANPERAASCDATMNIYSCGCLLYYLLTGETPHDGGSLTELIAARTNGPVRSPRQVNPNISPALEALVLRALAADPSKRFASLAELADALAALGPAGSRRPALDSREPRASASGAAAIGLFSSSPPELDRPSTLPPRALEPQARSSPKRKDAHTWIAVASLAALCLAAFLGVRTVLRSSNTREPASRATLSLRNVLPKEPLAGAAATSLATSPGALGSADPTPDIANVPVAPQPAPSPPALPLTARVRVADIQVQGGLPASLVRRAVDRLRSQFEDCYDRTAQAAGRNSFDELTVGIHIDQRGRAHNPRVQGASLPGLELCIAERTAGFVSEGPTDRHTAAVSWKLAFVP